MAALVGLQVLIVGCLIAGAVAILTVDGHAKGPVPSARTDRFDGDRAWAELLREVRLGPRSAGSPVLEGLARRLRSALPRGRIEPVAGGLRNIVGVLPGRRPAIALSAHYDTKDTPAGFVGANDGAAGTALVLEAARSIGREPVPARAREIRFVLFDGEEAPRGCARFLACGIRGSKAYAARHAHELEALVLADFVANRRLRLERDGGSDPALWARLRAAGRRVGVGAIFAESAQGTVQDDHTPFMRAGIPSIDLIDFDYPQWHSLGDTPAVLSRRSLDAAGEAVVELLRELRRR